MDAGADLEAKDEEGRTAATWAAGYGNSRLASLIEEVRLSRSEAEQMRQETAAKPGGGERPGRRGPRV